MTVADWDRRLPAGKSGSAGFQPALLLLLVALVACDGGTGVAADDVAPVWPDGGQAEIIAPGPDLMAETLAEPDIALPPTPNRVDEAALVIVAADPLVAAFAPLAEWRRARGVPTRLVALSAAVAGQAGRDVPEQLRNAIRGWRDEGARFVLLGGDHPMLPRREVHCEAYNAPEDAVLDDDIATDLYYADLDGDWDGDGDGVWAELEDGLDLFPDIAVGRVPARDDAQVANYFAKLRAYEEPDDPSFLGRAALLGEYAGDFGAMSLCSTVLLETFRALFPPELELRRYYAEECGRYEGARPNTFAAQRDMWNEGVGLVLDLGHGDWDTMGLMSTATIPALTNAARPGVYLTCECYGCEFDYPHAPQAACESFLVSPGGGVIYVGNTDFGVGVPWESAFYRVLLGHLYATPGIRAGELFQHALHHYAEGQWAQLASYPYDLRWTQLTLILMGDPSLPLWTGAPRPAEVTAEEAPAGLRVAVQQDGAPVAGALVALYGAERFLYTAETDAAGEARFAFAASLATPYQITVTGPTMRPWQAQY